MTVVILNEKTKEERARYEDVISFFVSPAPRITDLGLSFEHEDRIETISNDEIMMVE